MGLWNDEVRGHLALKFTKEIVRLEIALHEAKAETHAQMMLNVHNIELKNKQKDARHTAELGLNAAQQKIEKLESDIAEHRKRAQGPEKLAAGLAFELECTKTVVTNLKRALETAREETARMERKRDYWKKRAQKPRN